MAKKKESRASGGDLESAASNLVKGMFETESLEAQARYLSRGRPLAAVSDEELPFRWAQAFRDMFAERCKKNAQALDDATAELALRGREPDASLVRDELDALGKEAETDLEGREAIRRAIADYMRRLDQEMN